MSSSEEDQVVTWESRPNEVKHRLVDKSLAHIFTPGRKIKRRTKLLNSQLQNKHFPIKSYKDYIKIRTAVLRTLSDDEYTNDETDIEIIDVNETKKSKKKRSKPLKKSRKRSDSSDEKSSSLSESEVEKQVTDDDDDESPDDLGFKPSKLDVDERLNLQESSDNSPDLTQNKSRGKMRKKSRSVSPEYNFNGHVVNSPKKPDDFPKENILKDEIFEEFKGVFSQDLMSEGPSQNVDENGTKIEEEKYEPIRPLDDDQATFDSPSDSNDFDDEISSPINEEPVENNQQQFNDSPIIYESKHSPLEPESSFEIPSYQVPKESGNNELNSLRKHGNNLISMGHLKTRKDIKKNLNKLLDSVDSNESSDSIKSFVTDLTSQQVLVDEIPKILVENHEITSNKNEDFILPVAVSAELVKESNLEEEKKLIDPVVGPSDSGIDDDSRDNFNKNEEKNYEVEILNRKHNPKITSDEVIASKIKIIRCKDIIESDVKILPELSPEKSIVGDVHEMFSPREFDGDNYEKNGDKGPGIEEDCNKIVACCSSLQQNEVDLGPVEEVDLRESDEETLQHDHDINKTFVHFSDEELEETQEKIENKNDHQSDEALEKSQEKIENKNDNHLDEVSEETEEQIENKNDNYSDEELQETQEQIQNKNDHNSDEELQETQEQIQNKNNADVSLTEDESLQFILSKYAARKKPRDKSDDEDENLQQKEIEKDVVEFHEDPEEDSDENEVQITEDLNEKNINDESIDKEIRKKSENINSLVIATESDSLKYVLDRRTSRQRYQENNPFYENESMIADNNSQAELREEKTPEPFVPRPKDINDFADNNNLELEELDPTMILTDLSDDYDIWTMEIPKSVFQDDLRGKKIKLKHKSIIIGDMKFGIEKRELENLPIVLNTGSRKNPYQIEILEPQANVVVTRKKVNKEIIESVEEVDPLEIEVKSLPAESSDFKEPEPARVKSKHKKKRKKNTETLELKEKVTTDSSGVDEESIDLVVNKKIKNKKKNILDTDDNSGNLVSVDSVKSSKKKKRKASEDFSDKFTKKKKKKFMSTGNE